MPATYADRLQGLTTSVAVKPACRVATTANIALAGLGVIDGVQLVERDRVLVKDQANAVNNGVWTALSGAWRRALDFNGSRDAVGGTQVMVIEGAVNADTYWRVSGSDVVTVGVDDIEFEKALLSDIAVAAFIQAGAGAVATSSQTELRYFIRPEQFGAVGNGVADDTAAVVAADTHAAATGATVLFDAKVYKTTAKISKSYKTWWQGSRNPFPVIIANIPQPASAVCGTQIYKAHGGTCIEMIGPSTYSQCGGLSDIGIVSDKTTWPSGDGLVLDSVGSPRLIDIRIWFVGGDGLVLGTSVGDVTGQAHIRGLYVNGPGGKCIRNRSKWSKFAQVETDGGTHGYYGADAPNTDVTQFHFEGASVAGIALTGANGNTRFRGGFVGMTNVAADKGIDVVSASGNTDVTIDNVQIVGQGALDSGIDVGASAQRTAIINCDISDCPIGIIDGSDGTTIAANSFLSCELPIQASGDNSVYTGNRTVGTSGAWSIDQADGGTTLDTGGIWSGNKLDKPIKPTLFGGSQGNFGYNRVIENAGFRTNASGSQTFTASTGGNIAHTLAATPEVYAVWRLDGGEMPADFATTVDGTNIAISWTGSGTYGFGWDARLVGAGI